jgi:hypothetical protein
MPTPADWFLFLLIIALICALTVICVALVYL